MRDLQAKRISWKPLSTHQRSWSRIRNKNVVGNIAFSHLASPLFFQITLAISREIMRLKRADAGGTVLLEIFYRHYCPRRCRWVRRRLTAVLIHLKYGPNIAAPNSWEQSDTPSHMTYGAEAQRYITGYNAAALLTLRLCIFFLRTSVLGANGLYYEAIHVYKLPISGKRKRL